MTSEELAKARELANFLAVSPLRTRLTKSGKVVEVTQVADAADTITRLCDEVERLQREGASAPRQHLCTHIWGGIPPVTCPQCGKPTR